MTFEELIAEGHRLEKPCLYLTDEPNENGPVAYWGGEGPSNLPSGHLTWIGGYRHWITLDSSWLTKQGNSAEGVISVFECLENEDFEGPEFPLTEGTVIYQHKTTLEDVEIEGQKLYGVESRSFPPIDAVCLYGSEKVETWLREQNRKRTDYDALQGEIIDQYGDYWMERSPYSAPALHDQYFAVMGGWHIHWPDDDFYMPKEMELVVWTFRDAEPYVEVWSRRPNFILKLRST